MPVWEDRYSTASHGPVLNRAHCELLFPCTQSQCPSLHPGTSVLSLGSSAKSGLPLAAVPGRCGHSSQVTISPGVSQPSSPCSSCVSGMVQSLLEGPVLDVISFLKLSCTLGSPELHMVLQTGACWCLAGSSCFSRAGAEQPLGQWGL